MATSSASSKPPIILLPLLLDFLRVASSPIRISLQSHFFNSLKCTLSATGAAEELSLLARLHPPFACFAPS
jgi:hypothetical protein